MPETDPETDPRQTLAAFIAEHKITATVRPSRKLLRDGWPADARHWSVILHQEDRAMRVTFSQGSAHTAQPTVADVLSCVAMDSAGFENSPRFVEWADEMGYDTDSRKAEATFHAVRRQAVELRELLGDALYSVLLWEVDSDA